MTWNILLVCWCNYRYMICNCTLRHFLNNFMPEVTCRVLFRQNKFRNNDHFFHNMSLSTSSIQHGSHSQYSLELYVRSFHSHLTYYSQRLSAIIFLRHVVDNPEYPNLAKCVLQLSRPSSQQPLPCLLDAHAPDVNLRQGNSKLKILH